MAFGKSLENPQQLLIDFGEGDLCGFGTGVIFQSRGRDDPRIFSEVFNALANAIEELPHSIVDLANFTAATIQEIGLCRVPQI
ncbi:hypothetical protein D3C85_1089460 [compost metagenome]